MFPFEAPKLLFHLSRCSFSKLLSFHRDVPIEAPKLPSRCSFLKLLSFHQDVSIEAPKLPPRCSFWLFFYIPFVPARGHPRSLSEAVKLPCLAIILKLPSFPDGYSFWSRHSFSDPLWMTSFLRRFCLDSGILASFLTRCWLVSGSFGYNWCIASSIHDDWLRLVDPTA